MSDFTIKFFLLKVKARCNINCTYCYEYNSPDKSWKEKPSTMSFDVVQKTAERISGYVLKHDLKKITIIFHGGEPLLLSSDWFVETHKLFSFCLPKDVQVYYGLQTNGILLNVNHLNTFKELNIKLGVSLDGTKESNDKFRLDFKGESTFEKVLKGISLLNKAEYKSINGGILTVINPSNNPVDTFRFLSSLGTGFIDFLYPHYNHSSLPPFLKGEVGIWLTTIFDEWWNTNSDIIIRTFEDAIHLMVGGIYSVENLGLAPVELIVIQTDGAYEAVDSLKSTFDGAVFTGKNVFNDDFDSVLSHELIKSRLNRIEHLCETCKNCEFMKVCGGGYIPHRYNELNGFENPSVYCDDLKLFFNHVKNRLVEVIPEIELVGIT